LKWWTVVGFKHPPENVSGEEKVVYAIIATGGKQYLVRQGDIVKVEKLTGEVGSEVVFDQVLMVSDGENATVGTPVVDGVTVTGHITAQDRMRKILVFKQKRRKRYRRKNGHRQPCTAVKIDSIR